MPNVTAQFAHTFIGQIKTLVLEYFRNLSDKEIKSLNKKEFVMIFECLSHSLNEFSESSIEELESFKLEMSLKWFKSSSLEKRLSGLADIKVLI